MFGYFECFGYFLKSFSFLLLFKAFFLVKFFLLKSNILKFLFPLLAFLPVSFVSIYVSSAST